MRIFFICVSFCLFSIFPCFACEEISSYSEQRIAEFMKSRVEFSSCKSNMESMKLLDEFKRQTDQELPLHAIDIEQEKLIFDSFYVMERHHYMYDFEDKRPFLCDAMKSQMEKNEGYLSTLKGRENANKWLYVLTGDVTSCYMTFSLSATLRYGFHVKDLYEKALKLDSSLSYALTNLGQWMFYAPKIFGGGKKKALKCFSRAVESSKNDGEQFFSDMYMSQFYFDRKEMEKSKEFLEKASALNRKSSYLELIKILNENGWSLFYYNRHRAGIDADIKNSNFKEPVDEDD